MHNMPQHLLLTSRAKTYRHKDHSSPQVFPSTICLLQWQMADTAQSLIRHLKLQMRLLLIDVYYMLTLELHFMISHLLRM